jgi:hypothetical protein
MGRSGQSFKEQGVSTKISGTDGIDTAQLRAPDGDPVAMTIDNAGKVNFSVGVLGFQIVIEDLGAIGKQFGVKLPAWLGGIIINAGMRATMGYSATVTVGATGTYPIPFSNMDFASLVKRNAGLYVGVQTDEVMEPNTVGTWTIYNIATNGSVGYRVSWLAIGT